MERFGVVPLEPLSYPPDPSGQVYYQEVEKVETDRQLGSYTTTATLTANRLPPNNVFGKSNAGNWTAMKESDSVKPGDILRITYRTKIPFFQAWQVDNFISSLQKDDRYQLLYWSNSEEERRVWVEVRVIKPDFGLTVLLVAVAIAAIGVGIGFMLTTESIEKLADPKSVLGIGALFIMGIIGFIFFKQLGK